MYAIRSYYVFIDTIIAFQIFVALSFVASYCAVKRDAMSLAVLSVITSYSIHYTKLYENEAGNNVEKIFLKDKKINYCTGCGYCSSHGQSGCSQKDDMTEILDKMIDADAIVMATPVYFYAMNGQMKTFIDRVCAKYTSVSNKDFYFIATAADSSKRNNFV